MTVLPPTFSAIENFSKVKGLVGVGDSSAKKLERDFAWDSFLKLGIPSNSAEQWKYTSLKFLSEIEFSKADSEISKSWIKGIQNYLAARGLATSNVLVIVDGALSLSQLSPDISKMLKVKTSKDDIKTQEFPAAKLSSSKFSASEFENLSSFEFLNKSP